MKLATRHIFRCGLVAVLLATTSAHAGINGGGRSAGRITAFGSIFVNGIEYETDAATILVDGTPVSQAGLRIGQYVYVDGFVNPDELTGTAYTVVYESDVRGLVTAVDPVAATFTVLGQTVRVTGATQFAAAGGAGALRPGQVVEVSGARDASGALVASWVETTAAGSDRIVGTVTAHSAANRTFRIGDLVVDYSGAAHLEGAIQDGVLVEAKGGRAIAGTLVAASVETVAPGLGAYEGSSSALEGYVNATPVNGRLLVGTQPVQLSANVVYVDGTAADLVANQKVEIEGVVDATGTLVADQVTFQFDDAAHVHGTVTAVAAGTATLVVNGLTVEIAAETQFEDRSRQRLRTLRFADVRVGDHVETDGFEVAADATLRATRVQRIDPDGAPFIEGVAYGVQPGRFTLVDTPILTTARTKYADVNGHGLTREQFEAQALGREVKVRGTWTGASWIAEQAQFKN